MTVLTLRWLHDMQRSWAQFGNPWLRTRDADTPATGRGAPRTCLYTRDDASIDQKTSVLVLFSSYTDSTQFFRELPTDAGVLERFISCILGGPSPFWTSLELARSVCHTIPLLGYAERLF